MLKRINYLLFAPHIFEKSVLRRPRVSCMAIIGAVLLPIIAAVLLFAGLPYPWGAITYLAIIGLATLVFVYWQSYPAEIRHTWSYLRGREKDFWTFNKG